MTDWWVVYMAEWKNWPPDVTRRQTVRDLILLREAAQSKPEK